MIKFGTLDEILGQTQPQVKATFQACLLLSWTWGGGGGGGGGGIISLIDGGLFHSY